MIRSTMKNQQEKSKYPYIGINKTGVVVLFDKKNSGMIIYIDSGPSHRTGTYNTNFDEDSFIVCNYSITLGNSHC